MLATSGRGLRVSRIILIDSVYPRCPRPEAQKAPAKLHHAPALPGVSQETRDKLMTSLMRATCLSDQWEPPTWSMPRNGILGTTLLRDADPTPPHVLLIRAKDMVPMAEAGEVCPLDRTRFLLQLGWEDMVEGFVERVIETSGNHYSIFDPEYVCISEY